MRLFRVGSAAADAVTTGIVLLPVSLLLYLKMLRCGARLPSDGGAWQAHGRAEAQQIFHRCR